MGLLFRVTVRLLFGRKHKHYIVLNINYSDQNVTKYWMSFLKPAYLIITNYKKGFDFIDKLINNTISNKGKIIYNYQDKELLKATLHNYQKIYSFGSEASNNSLYIEENDNLIKYSCFKDSISVRKNLLPGINKEIIASSLFIGKIKNINLTDGLYAIIKHGLPKRLLMQIKANLKA
jgi:hypothetical protein